MRKGRNTGQTEPRSVSDSRRVKLYGRVNIVTNSFCDPIFIRVSLNVRSLLRLPWERPLLRPDVLSGEDYQLPSGCTQYYVPGAPSHSLS